MKNSGWTNLKYLIDIINKHQSKPYKILIKIIIQKNLNFKKWPSLLSIYIATTTIITIRNVPILPYACWDIGRLSYKRNLKKKTHNIQPKNLHRTLHIWWCLKFKSKKYILPPIICQLLLHTHTPRKQIQNT